MSSYIIPTVAWKGTNTIFALEQKTTNWEWAAELLGAGDQFYGTQDSLDPDAQLIRSAGLNGSPFRSPGIKGNEFHAGDIPFPLDYEFMHKLLALTFGSVSAPDQQGTGVSAYEHEIIMASDLEGIYSTLVIGHEDLFVREYPSVKHGSIAISIQAGDNEPTMTCSLVPRSLTLDDSGPNKLTTLDSITPRVTVNAPVEFRHMKMFMNDNDGGALGSSDEFYISGVNMTLDANLRPQSVTTRNAPYVDEPIRNGWLLATLGLSFAELTTKDMIEYALDKTRKKISLELTSDQVCDDPEVFSARFEFCNVQFDTASTSVGGEGVVEPSYSCEASKAASTPTGFGSSDAVRAWVINSDADAALN